MLQCPQGWGAPALVALSILILSVVQWLVSLSAGSASPEAEAANTKDVDVEAHQVQTALHRCSALI